MAHHPEMDHFYRFDMLSSGSTKLLLKGNFSADTQRRIQQDLNAYCILDPRTFAGVIYHPDGSGPEKPYLKPEGTDWLPEVQAIAEIGFQSEYWSLLHNAAATGRIQIPFIKSADMLVLLPTANSRAWVETNSYHDSLKIAASEAGDPTPRFPKYVKLFNCGGDLDFYGSNDNEIFPMNVRNHTGMTMVTRESLGITEQMVQEVWNSRNTISSKFATSFHNAVLRTYTQLPTPVSELFRDALQRGQIFDHDSQISEFLRKNKQIVNPEDIFTYIDWFREAMGGPALNQNVLQAIANHAKNLAVLYETAKNYRRDIYQY